MRPLGGGYYYVPSMRCFWRAAQHFDYEMPTDRIYGRLKRQQYPAIVIFRYGHHILRGQTLHAFAIPTTDSQAADLVALVNSGKHITKRCMHPLGSNFFIVNSYSGFKKALIHYDYRHNGDHTTAGVMGSFPAFVSIGEGYAGALHANCIPLDDLMNWFA